MIGLARGLGRVAASSLVIGALIALTRPVPKLPLGLIMAFGSGVLVSSVAYELVEEAVAVGGQLPMALAWRLDRSCSSWATGRSIRLGAAGMGSVKGPAAPESGLPIVLGAALDGIPESVVLGLTLSAGGA